MIKLNIVIFSTIFLISCSTITEPIDTISSDYDVYIRPTGDANENYQEFSFTNGTDHTLYYRGFSKTTPFYAAQMQNDTGWVHYIYWRCPVGSELIELISGETIKTNVHLPPDNLPWKVGLSVRNEADGEEYYSWSTIQNYFKFNTIRSGANINMSRNNSRFAIIILMIITLMNCKDSVTNLEGWEIPDCINLKMAIIDLNSDMVKIEINKMLTDLEPKPTEDDEWGHEKNLDILINRLNSNCDSIDASLFCYCCNKSLPPQSIIILSVDSSRTIITRSLDIWTSDDDILQCTEIHKYHN